MGAIDLSRVVSVESCGRSFLAVDPAQYPLADYVFRDELDVKTQYWSDIGPDEVVIDIGASWGGWTLLALAQGARVIALEPGHYALDVLRRNVGANGWSERCTILETVLGDGSGMTDARYRAEMKQYYEMPPDQWSITLDALAENLGLRRLDRVKCDVEGAEAAILRGASRTLHQFRPRLVIEDHTDADRPSVNAECVSLLVSAGYEVRSWQPERGRPFICATVRAGLEHRRVMG